MVTEKVVSRLALDLSELDTRREPMYEKLYSLCKTRIEERCGARVVEENAQFTLRFAEDLSMTDEAYTLSDTADGIVIRGRNFRSLVFGLGRFLHGSRYDEQGIRILTWRGDSAPDCPMRIVYFAMHFYNGYCAMPSEDLVRMLEDLMLWGFNGICAIFGGSSCTGFDDPEYIRGGKLLRRVFNAAKAVGMTTTTFTGTLDFLVTNPAYAADKSGIFAKGGNCLCPSKPGGYDYIVNKNMKGLRMLLADCDVDYIVFWCYDEGGCSCEKCAPWGGNGYYRWARGQYRRMQEEFGEKCPKAILTTWHFDFGCNDPRDFPWLDRAIREDKARGDDWISYIMLETRRGVPEYIQKNGIPGDVPAIDFPEITMRYLDPWGGWGANPLPTVVEDMWHQMSEQVYGGMCYSEGFYDDVNKAVIAQLMWDKSCMTETVFADYCGYEFREAVTEKFWEMADLMERNQIRTHISNKQPPDMEEVAKIRDLGEQINGTLPEKIRTGWRWRLQYLRSVLDYERYTAGQPYNWGFDDMKKDKYSHWGKFLIGNEKAQKALWELIEMYRMPEVYDPDFHVLHYYIRPNHESNPAYAELKK